MPSINLLTYLLTSPTSDYYNETGLFLVFYVQFSTEALIHSVHDINTALNSSVLGVTVTFITGVGEDF